MGSTNGRASLVRFRSKLSWTKVIAWSTLGTAALFTVLDWHGCWYFRHGAAGMVVFVYVFAWLAAFFTIGPAWRIVLSIVTVIALVPIAGLRWGLSEQNSGPEAAAVQAVRAIQNSLHEYAAEHEGREYPNTMPKVALSPWAEKFYRFDYVPSRSADGKFRGYQLQATPARRECEFHRSFTITGADGGRIFWTMEPRAATSSDMYFLE
jgi:hypothetical protein